MATLKELGLEQKKENTRVTFTGIDRKTDIDQLVAIQKKYPMVEFGFLVGGIDRQGVEARYPSISLLSKLCGANLNLACHVCGRRAREILTTGSFAVLQRYLNDYTPLFQRIQLNVSGMDAALLPKEISFAAPPGVKEIIIQQHPDRTLIRKRVTKSNVPVSVLYDASGGLGIESDLRPVNSDYRAGYAGGINPSNVRRKFLQLKNSGIYEEFWIDMESGVRTNDWFDIEKVKEVLSAIEDLL